MGGSSKSHLEELPQEIYQNICSYLTPRDHARLALSSRQLYWISQEVLYRKLKLGSFTSLYKFAKALNEASFSNVRNDKVHPTRIYKKDIKYVELTLQGRSESSRPVPPGSTNFLYISRMVGTIISKCPNVEITLRLVNWPCHQFSTMEPLHRVVRLIACFGIEGARHAPHGRRTVLQCRAKQDTTAFWKCYLGGDVFPDLRSLELDHFWKSPSDRTSSIFDAASALDPHCGDYHRLSHLSPHPWGPWPAPIPLRRRCRPTKPQDHRNLDYQFSGLQNMHHLSLTYMAELDVWTFTKVLLSDTVQAHNLRTLELKHIHLPLDLLGPLLTRCLPLLRGLTLHTPSDSLPWWTSSPSSAGQASHHYHAKDDSDIAHICPLLRDLGRTLHTLDLAIPSACNELFISPRERRVLREAGVYLTPHGTNPPAELPAPAMSLAAGWMVNPSGHNSSSSSSSSGSGRSAAVDTHHLRATLLAHRARDVDVQREAYLREHPDAPTHAFDVERRDRLAAIRDTGMRRRVVLWTRPCTGLGGWDEMLCEADLEEDGMLWELVCVPLRRASRHVGGGEVGTPVEMGELLGGEVDELLGGGSGRATGAHDASEEDDF